VAQCVQCELELAPGAQFCASCGAQVTVRNEPEVDPYLGRVFAQKYRVENLLGEGGMGRVYRAVQLSLDKVVCLKVLRRELAGDPSTQARFQREARAASRLNHPNSIQVMDFGSAEGGELYLTMEYIKGRDLQQLLTAEFPLDEPRVCHIMAQVLDALAEAHAQHVIHRDLKPENIMVCDSRGDANYVKVLDFGIAKIQDTITQPKLTRAGLVCGTPEYMSPEQARGLELDARSDLYSAGIILYQMVTGTLPFNADNPIGFVTAHLNDPPVPPRERRPEVSVAMEGLILRTLNKNRDARPASAKAMWSELLAIQRGEDPEPPTDVTASVGGIRDALASVAVTDKVRRSSPIAVQPGTQPGTRSRFGLVAGALAVMVIAGGAFSAYRLIPAKSADPGAAPTPAAGAPTAPSTAEKGMELFKQAKDTYRSAFAETSNADLRHDLMNQALHQFYSAYKLNPTEPAPLKWMGVVNTALGNTEQAVDSYNQYLKAEPPPPDVADIRKTVALLAQQLPAK